MDVLPSDGFKALIHHMPKMDPSVEVPLSFQYVVRIIKPNLDAKYQEQKAKEKGTSRGFFTV